MKKNVKRSVFSVVLCAMLVFCVSFYSSVDPTTAWFSDTGSQSGSFNMDEISITFVGDGIETDLNGEQSSNTIELNFKAATKAVDEDNENNPDEMFEHAAEFYTFTATNNSQDTTAEMRIGVAADSGSGVNYRVYELGEAVSADGVTLFVEGANAASAFDDIYVDASGERVIKIGDMYYDACLKENLSVASDKLLLDSGATKTYCIGIWAEYSEFDTAADTLDTITCNATVNISAEQYVEAETDTSASAE